MITSEMEISEETERFLQELDRFSHHRLKHRETLGGLIELARKQNRQRLLDDIAFLSKFLWNAYTVIRREGPNSENTTKLLAEYNVNLEKVIMLIKTLIIGASEAVKQHFQTEFLSMTQESMTNFLSLLSDLSWMQNLSIDHKTSK